MALRVGKDKNHIHQWLMSPDGKGARNIGSRSARLLEVSFQKPSGWMDSDPEAFIEPDGTPSHSSYRQSRATRPTAAILMEAVKVMDIDEAVNGPYPPLKHAELLLELCDRLAAGDDAMTLVAQATKQRQVGGADGARETKAR